MEVRAGIQTGQRRLYLDLPDSDQHIPYLDQERKHRQTDAIESAAILLQEQKVESDTRLAWLYETIHQMDAIDRSIVLLMLEGFSYKEMAAIMGITESNAGVKINRIKKRLIARSAKQDCYGI